MVRQVLFLNIFFWNEHVNFQFSILISSLSFQKALSILVVLGGRVDIPDQPFYIVNTLFKLSLNERSLRKVSFCILLVKQLIK